MTDDNNLVSRRTALKGIAGLAGTGAVGAGTVIHASQPAAATAHQIKIDDLTIELSAEDGEPVGLSELGLSDIRFTAEWENITTSVGASMQFFTSAANGIETTLGVADLGVDGSGFNAFGYGPNFEMTADATDVNLGGSSYFPGGTPLHVDSNKVNGPAFLDELSLGGSESERTVLIRYTLLLRLANEDGSIDEASPVLENIDADFDVTLNRISPDAEAYGGAADAYGESE